MFNNVALDVFIGLIFIFLLYGLLTTIIQELISRFLSLRARMQVRAIARMLDDEPFKSYKLQLINAIRDISVSLFYFFSGPTSWNRPFTRKFYEHQAIKYLGESTWRSKPSYLECETFSQTLIDILRGDEYDGSQPQMDLIKDTLMNKSEILSGNKSIGKETLKQLRLLFNESAGDIERFKTALEDWFNKTMDRCTGWFKTQAQLISFIIGFILAITLNVDTIFISRILTHDKNAREQMVELAAKANEKGDPSVLKQTYDEVRKSIDASNLILGFDRTKLTDAQRKIMDELEPNSHLPGWILTALAISLGAPFWFDLLNKIMQFRNSGKRNEPSSEPSSSSPAQKNVPSSRRKG